MGMGKVKKQCEEAFCAFQEKHPIFFQQQIIQSFLQQPNCLSYVKKAVCFPTNENLKKVDEAFKEFYGKVRILTYLSNMIYYNAINYDRKIKKDKDREMLILDKPLKEDGEEGVTHKDVLCQTNSDLISAIAGETISEHVEEKDLFEAIQTLTSKQQEIINYKYIFGLKNKEIAEMLGNSPQNISAIHQRALRKLKNYLEKERNDYDDS